MRKVLLLLATLLASTSAQSKAQAPTSYLLMPDRIYDGTDPLPHLAWAVLVKGDKIAAVGPVAQMRNQATDAVPVDLTGMTLLPGLIENHSHLFLHPYTEASWNDQVLKEPLALRTARAVVHAERTLKAGFTTIRDLGTEGAGYGDVGIKKAIEQGIIPGPRMLVTTRAIVATGSYGPHLSTDVELPQGAEEANGYDDLARVVRSQIGHGADWIKVYADYSWGPGGQTMPTFTQDELTQIVEIARSSGRSVVAHASTAEGMRRAVIAGVETIEHGDNGTAEVFRLMAQRGVALCPTLAASATIPSRIPNKRNSFKLALAAKVPICAGSDVGVFAHGDNVRELELMVDYGMSPVDVLRSATSFNATILHMQDKLGVVKTNAFADLIAVEGDPTVSISALRAVKFVMKGGSIYVGDANPK